MVYTQVMDQKSELDTPEGSTPTTKGSISELDIVAIAKQLHKLVMSNIRLVTDGMTKTFKGQIQTLQQANSDLKEENKEFHLQLDDLEQDTLKFNLWITGFLLKENQY